MKILCDFISEYIYIYFIENSFFSWRIWNLDIWLIFVKGVDLIFQNNYVLKLWHSYFELVYYLNKSFNSSDIFKDLRTIFTQFYKFFRLKVESISLFDIKFNFIFYRVGIY